jgi:methionyl-tRNA formyltransferase
MVTPEIDGGEILKVVPVKLDPQDNFSSVNLKLSIKCYQVLASVILDILSGKEFERKRNNGKLFFGRTAI